ncbi:hypothetical protein GCM10009431_08000 [Gaetbulibacter jejuensis]|uniref:Uncharacterized protein n=1 Tax=Gaetbulibacter jejuensis TaxID=584607 RepID=A0ABN1JGZ1_9FLAO
MSFATVIIIILFELLMLPILIYLYLKYRFTYKDIKQKHTKTVTKELGEKK